MERWTHRRGLLALAASLAVHLWVLVAALSAERTLPPTVRAPTGEPFARLTWIDATPFGQSMSSPSAMGVPERFDASTRGTWRGTLDGVKGSLKASRTSRPSTPLGNNGAVHDGPATPPASDAPRVFDLTPSTVPGAEEPAAALLGRTLYPGDLPSEAELRAEEHARVSALVENWGHRDAAHARVQGGGIVDPAYGELGAALRGATDEVPRFIDTNSVKEVAGALFQSWGVGAERYGKTGAPYDEPGGRLENVERPAAAAAEALRGSPDAQAMVSFLAAGARLQEFADGRTGLELYTLVELNQEPGGALESVRLLRPSGLASFDRWVTGRAREVGLAFALDAGARTRALRSVWRFDGVILYRRKLERGQLDGRAALGVATMAALSMLSGLANTTPKDPINPRDRRDLGPLMPGFAGRFDELTGELDVIDLSNPTYDCRVTLLEAD